MVKKHLPIVSSTVAETPADAIRRRSTEGV
jgi:hypothetical protein